MFALTWRQAATFPGYRDGKTRGRAVNSGRVRSFRLSFPGRLLMFRVRLLALTWRRLAMLGMLLFFLLWSHSFFVCTSFFLSWLLLLLHMKILFSSLFRFPTLFRFNSALHYPSFSLSPPYPFLPFLCKSLGLR